MIIGLDFDGTCVEHEYPAIGADVPHAIWSLKKLVREHGAQIILYTMRSGKYLDEAIAWFMKNDIPLLAVNQNVSQKDWTTSSKVYADLYVDDAAVGCPLIRPKDKRPFVDWIVTYELILHRAGKR